MKIGDFIPAFAVEDQDGNVVSNESLLGSKTVLYFYPKDSTPGCTAEACNLRDNYHLFLANGYKVFGVSKDSRKSHVNFRNKYELPFPLLSDPTTAMLQAFGAERIEALCDVFCRDIGKELGVRTGPRFSPGYGDLPLDAQKMIFSVLDCEKRIGLFLNDSLLMSPSKSVTAFVGIGGEKKQHKNRCSFCQMRDCTFRGAL